MILITGGSGMIGQALVDNFQHADNSLRIQVRNRRQIASAAGVEIQELDFSNASAQDFARLVNGCKTVIHTAGLVHKPEAGYNEYELLNVRSTQQLAEAALAAGVETFVFLSTIAVYGSGTLDNVDETSPARPDTPYAVSKHKSELWLNSFKGFKKTIVIRPALVFGEGDRGNMIKLIKQIKSGRYFHISPNTACKSLIYAKDLARAIEMSISKTPNGFHIYNAANPQPVSVKHLGDNISLCLKRKSKIPTLPSSLVRMGAKLSEKMLKHKSPIRLEQVDKLSCTTSCSTAKLAAQTSFTPQHSLEQALRAEIAWAKSASLL